jgi:hypothetical protein
MAFVTKDKFGNNKMVVSLKDKKGNGYPKGYGEIKGKLYKFEYSDAKKDGVEGWVSVTEVSKRDNSNRKGL